ncbi:hypothetical protein EVAR_56132_1 [Eumeta japonica]|uniref:Uncharacterized protein n=1 Tax=Eumeta variegata TaxID=151549 RepID=A0A4C1Z6S2_EUMVA|nr:hypothetical protein EVAR_56132_1 [Eumeta japonica]
MARRDGRAPAAASAAAGVHGAVVGFFSDGIPISNAPERSTHVCKRPLVGLRDVVLRRWSFGTFVVLDGIRRAHTCPRVFETSPETEDKFY